MLAGLIIITYALFSFHFFFLLLLNTIKPYFCFVKIKYEFCHPRRMLSNEFRPTGTNTLYLFRGTSGKTLLAKQQFGDL